MTRAPSPYSLQGVQAALRQQQRTTGMEDLPIKPERIGPPEKPKRKHSARRKAARQQPRDRHGRFAEKPGIFTRAFDGIERAQKTVKKMHRLAVRSRRPQREAGYLPPTRRVKRKQVVAPQPNYRQSVRRHLWGWVQGLFGRKQS